MHIHLHIRMCVYIVYICMHITYTHPLLQDEASAYEQACTSHQWHVSINSTWPWHPRKLTRHLKCDACLQWCQPTVDLSPHVSGRRLSRILNHRLTMIDGMIRIMVQIPLAYRGWSSATTMTLSIPITLIQAFMYHSLPIKSRHKLTINHPINLDHQETI